jgi:hypothetical protein
MPVHFDLVHATVANHPVVGRTVAAVRRDLGRPTYVEHFARRIDLGYGSRTRPRLEVIFNGTAWAIVFEDPQDVEAKLGRLLELTPQALQARIARVYAGAFRLVRSYRCDAKGCFGLFFSRDGVRRLIFGVSRGHRYVGLQLTRPP